MANIAIFRINYKSDFILTLNSDAGWMTPFCIKFWTGAPSQAYFVGYDGTTYTHCAPVAGDPTKLEVQFDDHHLPIGDLKFQIGYHFTVADFPTTVEDEVINQAAVIIDQDGTPMQVMLDLNGETAPEIQFSLPAYANEAQRIANEEQRIAKETQRIANEETRIQHEESRIAAEQTRQQNEQQRINQEQARVNEFAVLKRESEQATTDANNAAENARQKAQLAQDKATLAQAAAQLCNDKAALAQAAAQLANDKAQLAADKAALAQAASQLCDEKAALAQQKATYAQQQGDYSKAQGDYAKEQGDYSKAQGDYSKEQGDYSKEQGDYAKDKGDICAADHQTAVADHQTATADHQTAAADHQTATADHNQAGNDHTRAESDHTRAEIDHAAVEVYVDSLGVFDLSKHNAVGGVLATYADLSAALTALNALDSQYKYGGMSFKFVQTSDNKYVQYRLMADDWSTTVSDWQGVDDVPTAESDNLVTSGGVEEYLLNNFSYTKELTFIQGRYDLTVTPPEQISETVTITSDFIEPFYIKVNSGYKILEYVRFDRNLNFVDGQLFSDVVTELNLTDNNFLYKICLRKINTTDITPDDSESAINTYYSYKWKSDILINALIVPYVPQFIQGRYDASDMGLLIDESITISTADKLEYIHIKVNDGYRIQGYCRWDKNGSFIGGENLSDIVKELEFGNDEYLYTVALRKTDSSSFRPSEVTNALSFCYVSSIYKESAEIAIINKDIAEIDRPIFQNGRWDASDRGVLAIDADNLSICSTNFYPAIKMVLTNDYKVQGYCRYTKDGVFVDGVNYQDIIRTLDLPYSEEYKYKFTLRKVDGTSIYPSDAINAFLYCVYPMNDLIQEEIDGLKERCDIIEGDNHLLPFTFNFPRCDGQEGSINLSTITVAQMYSLWDTLINTYPSYLSVTDLGTDESGEYHLKKITFNYDGNDQTEYAKRKVLILANIHGPGESGDSKMQSYIVYYFIKWILDNKAEDELAQWFIMNYQFVIIPIENPWGYDNNSRGNYRNVDLARNFDADWVAGESYAGTTNGSSAASEKETQYAQAMISANTDAYMFIDFHSHLEGSTLMQVLPNSNGTLFKIGKSVKRYCKIVANSNIDNYYETTDGKPAKYAEEVKGIPAAVLEGAPSDGTSNFSNKAMTDSTRMFLAMLRIN